MLVRFVEIRKNFNLMNPSLQKEFGTQKIDGIPLWEILITYELTIETQVEADFRKRISTNKAYEKLNCNLTLLLFAKTFVD